MDPIAHTLAGAALAQTKLRRLSPLATATLAIGANLPDVDVVANFWGEDTSLLVRRGWSHGVLALVFLPLVLAAIVLGYDRWIRRRFWPDLPPVQMKGVLILSYVGTLSHPALDWLNTYGVRLLMPFSGKWFYGDALFIVDPWMWLLFGASVVAAFSTKLFGKVFWAILGLATTTLIFSVDLVPPVARVIWVLGIVLIVWIRWRGVRVIENERLAAACFVAFTAYLGGVFAGSNRAKAMVLDSIPSAHGAVVDIMTGPLPADPFRRYVVVKTEKFYHGFDVGLFSADGTKEAFNPIEIVAPDAIVTRALAAPEIRGFVGWMRFPIYSVTRVANGYQVSIRDLRYVKPDEGRPRGIGFAEIFLPDSV